ncbi:MAG TPA: hypothetical protein VF520_10785 [Thermoleophilaceae bacterium]|jgi:hypothetical protein
MADFLTDQRNALEQRLKELRPLYDEYLSLERVKEALEGVGGSGRRRGPGRPPGSRTNTATGTRRKSSNGRRRRGRGGATRADQALKVVRENPGITVSQIGDRLNIKQKNYLYRVMANLEKDGAVKKQGKGFTAT